MLVGITSGCFKSPQVVWIIKYFSIEVKKNIINKQRILTGKIRCKIGRYLQRNEGKNPQSITLIRKKKQLRPQVIFWNKFENCSKNTELQIPQLETKPSFLTFAFIGGMYTFIIMVFFLFFLFCETDTETVSQDIFFKVYIWWVLFHLRMGQYWR